MISQEKRLIITFRCTTDAIAMEKSCKEISEVRKSAGERSGNIKTGVFPVK